MKFIRNKLTGKIVYRENPHTDMTIKNASAGATSLEDLEVVDEHDWTEQKWEDEINLEKPYDESRRNAYLSIGDELDMIYKDIVAGNLTTKGMFAKHVKKVKDDHPKE